MKTAFELLKEAYEAFIAVDVSTLKKLYADDVDYRLGSWTSTGPDGMAELAMRSLSDGRVSHILSVSYHDIMESEDGSTCWVNARWTYQRPEGRRRCWAPRSSGGEQEVAHHVKRRDALIVINRVYGDLSTIMGY